MFGWGGKVCSIHHNDHNTHRDADHDVYIGDNDGTYTCANTINENNIHTGADTRAHSSSDSITHTRAYTSHSCGWENGDLGRGDTKRLECAANEEPLGDRVGQQGAWVESAGEAGWGGGLVAIDR